jgi:hypothetical protein
MIWKVHERKPSCSGFWDFLDKLENFKMNGRLLYRSLKKTNSMYLADKFYVRDLNTIQWRNNVARDGNISEVKAEMGIKD